MLAIGWWNLIGSLMMIGFFNESFGKKMLNEWTKIFATEFKLDYWSKLWMGWTIGLNIFFGAVNILAADYALEELKIAIIAFDIFGYAFFLALAFWGMRVGRCGIGIYSVFLIFLMWIGWAIFSLLYK